MAQPKSRSRGKAAASDANGGNGSVVDYRADLWRMADALRGSMDAAEYKHVVLGLIFLKYISDAFEELHAKLVEFEDSEGADPEEQDEYAAQNVFWVPSEARWPKIQGQARQPEIGQVIDDAMLAVERDNNALSGVLPKDYARPALDKVALGQVVDLVSNIRVGGAEARATDVLGEVYQYFLSQFALAEGRKGGEFYTPQAVVKLLVAMIQPFKGRVYDPCCGSSGMFVQSMNFITAHATGTATAATRAATCRSMGRNPTTPPGGWARTNLAIRASRDRSPTVTASTTTFTPTSGPTTSWQTRPSTCPTGAATGCTTTRAGCTACRPGATPTSPGCSTSSTTWLPTASPASCWPTAPCRPTSLAKATSAGTSSKPTWWTASSPCPGSCSSPPRYPPACGLFPGDASAGCGTGRGKRCSSTHARWAT